MKDLSKYISNSEEWSSHVGYWRRLEFLKQNNYSDFNKLHLIIIACVRKVRYLIKDELTIKVFELIESFARKEIDPEVFLTILSNIHGKRFVNNSKESESVECVWCSAITMTLNDDNIFINFSRALSCASTAITLDINPKAKKTTPNDIIKSTTEINMGVAKDIDSLIPTFISWEEIEELLN